MRWIKNSRPVRKKQLDQTINKNHTKRHFPRLQPQDFGEATVLKGRWMNEMTLTFRSISSGNTKSDYMAHELNVLQLTSAPTSTELPLPKEGGSRFKRIVDVCLQTYTASKPTMAVGSYGISALYVRVFNIDALHFCRK
jgi:hypothetical protein